MLDGIQPEAPNPVPAAEQHKHIPARSEFLFDRYRLDDNQRFPVDALSDAGVQYHALE